MDSPSSWEHISNLIDRFGDEAHVARRVRTLREAREWSQIELAERMTELGNPMNKSSIWRIENPDSKAGRRGITIGEAIGLARAFETTLAELLLPDDAIHDVEGWSAVIRAAEALNSVRLAWREYMRAASDAQRMVNGSDSLRRHVSSELDNRRDRNAESHVANWRKYQLHRIEKGEGVTMEDLNADDDTVRASDEFRRFLDAQQPIPLIVAIEDVLEGDEPDGDAWARRHHRS